MNFNKMSEKNMAQWQCDHCISLDPRQTKNGASDNAFNSPALTPMHSEKNAQQSTPQSKFYDVDELTALIEKHLIDFRKSIISYIDDKMNVIAKRMDSLKKQNEDIIKSADFLSNRYDNLAERMEMLEKQNSVIPILQKTNKELNEKLSLVQYKTDNYEQQQRRCDVEIRGIPEEHKNLQQLLEKIGSHVNCEIKPDDILNISRQFYRKSDNKPRALVVKFHHEAKRNNLLKAVKDYNKICKDVSKKLNTRDLGISDISAPIYVSENLTRTTKYLLGRAKAFARENRFKYVWVNNGRIFIRQDDNIKPVLITNDRIFLELK